VYRVLVIDDDPGIRDVVSAVLTDEGYTVFTAANGHEGLDLVANRHPHAILLDMRMPGMDGWEFARKFHESYGHTTPILVMTAAQDANERGVAIDAEGIIPKPFDLDFLLARVARAVAPDVAGT
jgi:DNA-binding response OmpR family regulator